MSDISLHSTRKPAFIKSSKGGSFGSSTSLKPSASLKKQNTTSLKSSNGGFGASSKASLTRKTESFSVDKAMSLSEDSAVNPISRRHFDFPTAEQVRYAQSEPGSDILTVDDALRLGIKMGASDIYLKPNEPVWYKVNGKAFPTKNFDWLTQEEFETLAYNVVTPTIAVTFTQDLELDTSYVIQDGEFEGSRFRVNFTRSDDHGITLVFRYINPRIETPDTLGVPQEVVDWIDMPKGLVLVCGVTGSGKSTSLSALIREIQLKYRYHIITVERPVETIYPKDGLSLVTQREVGYDTLSFENAVKSAMRQAPDVILIGEIRTHDEIDAAITSSTTGHLTFTTLHTSDCEETIDRILAQYSANEREDVLSRLSSNLQGVMAQQLLQRKDGTGRIPVHEILLVNDDVSRLIEKGDTRGIHDYLYDRKMTMNHNLLNLVLSGDIAFSEAMRHSTNVHELMNLAHAPGLSERINYDE